MDCYNEFDKWNKALAGTEYSDQLTKLAENYNELTDSFYTHLEFGTAGMRGVIGLGTNRMNVFTVRRCSKGLADFINAEFSSGSVAIAYDSRNFSSEFALNAALTLTANGIKVYLYDSLHSVPQLSFAVRQLLCTAGIVITASHNPREYNGYKVYGSDGGQVTPDDADKIMQYINAVDDIFNIPILTEQQALDNGLLEYIGKDIDDKYYENVLSLVHSEKLLKEHAESFKIVYTPLHGTGNKPVRHILDKLGFKNIYIVPEQEEPNGDFPTVSAPNPEMPDAFSLAIKLANEKNADIIIATDPDSDRMGLAVRNYNGEFEVLGGNTIGCLLMDFVLSNTQINPGDFVVKSVVSTPMADVIASGNNVEMRTVLTGFKNIAEQIKLSEETNSGRFLFGFEESYGYLTGTFVRDKDAIIATMLAAEAACYHISNGHTLYEAVQKMYDKYGYYNETVISKTLYGMEGLAKIASAMEHIRTEKLKEIVGKPVICTYDYLSGISYMSDGSEKPINLPPTNMMSFDFDGGRLMFRPSGTEPKLKVYLSVHANTQADADAAMDTLKEYTNKLLNSIT